MINCLSCGRESSLTAGCQYCNSIQYYQGYGQPVQQPFQGYAILHEPNYITDIRRKLDRIDYLLCQMLDNSKNNTSDTTEKS